MSDHLPLESAPPLLQGEGRGEDGVKVPDCAPHPHPVLPLEGEGTWSGRSSLIGKGNDKVTPITALCLGLFLAVAVAVAGVPDTVRAEPAPQAVPGRAEPASKVLTLDAALAIALEQNRDIQKARAYGEMVQGRYVEERAAALPSLALTGSAEYSKDRSQGLLFGGVSSQKSGALDLRLNQTLFSWGKVGAAIRGAREGLKTAEDQLRIFQQAARRDVSIAFYDVLLAKELRALALSNLQQKERHLAEAQKRLSAGVATDYDLLAAQVAVENARPELIRSENRIRTARERLRLVLALEPGEIDAVGSLEAPLAPIPGFEESLELARRNRPELADLKHRVGIYRELLYIASAGNKPTLDLRAGTGYHQLSAGERTGSGAAWDAGVFLTFPFFDGLRTSGKVQQARSELRTRELEEAQQLDEVSLEVRNAGFGVNEAQQILGALTGTVKQAERLLAMAEQGYQLGVKIRLEVEDAELNLVQARSNLAQARRDYQVSLVNLAWATGVLGER